MFLSAGVMQIRGGLTALGGRAAHISQALLSRQTALSQVLLLQDQVVAEPGRLPQCLILPTSLGVEVHSASTRAAVRPTAHG